MKIYKDGCSEITIGDETFTADADGIIDVPDGKVSTKIWSSGFVSAKARIYQLEKEAEALVVVEPIPDVAVIETAITEPKPKK